MEPFLVTLQGSLALLVAISAQIGGLYSSLFSAILPYVLLFSAINWEVLNGVGVDGVGMNFPFFYAFFLFLYAFSPFFLHFSLLPLKDKGKQQQFTAKMGNFTPTPSAPTPCKTSRIKRY